jgi:hypothetical protein
MPSDQITAGRSDDEECRECDCDIEPPCDPNDPGAYPGPDEDCECLCHG